MKVKELYIPLSMLEVSLRNSINSLFKIFYGAAWIVNEAQFLKNKEIIKIEFAKEKIMKNREQITQDKFVSELLFGFWTALFQFAYADKMRTAYLKQIFPNLSPKNIELINRKTVSAKLNHIRKFRNRVFYHENIIKHEFIGIENDISEILTYFDDEVCVFAKRVNDE